MKKLFNLFITLSLAFISLFSFSTANIAFANDDEDTSQVIADRLTYTDGVHQLKANFVEEEDYIVRNGNFEYQILLPAIQKTIEATAYSEFTILLKRAIGNVPFSVVFDDAITAFNPEDKYISIGQTKLLGPEFANVDYDLDQLGKNGARIKTVGKSIFLVGGIDNGILNAVYTFFRLAFNYEQYTKNCLEIDTNVQNLKLIDFDVIEVPDIQYNTATYGPTASYKTPVEADYRALLQEGITRDDVAKEINLSQERLRYYGQTNHYLLNLVFGKYNNQTTGSNHATLVIYSEPNKAAPGNEDIEMKHDLWFSNGHQLCYKAKGVDEEIPNMQRFGANYIISVMKKNPVSKYPGADYYPFGNMDGGGYCECDYCRASMAENNGTYATAYIEFVNGMCEMIEEEQQKSLNDGDDTNDDWVRPNFQFMLYAYDRTKKAPAEYDEELGKYVTLNGLEVSEHIHMSTTAYPFARYDLYDERTTGLLASVQAWGDIVHNFGVWDYANNYLATGVFMDCLNGFSSAKAQHMASLGVEWRTTEVQSGKEVVSCWFNLTYYIIGKQCWNSVYDAEELIDNFFNAYYGPAADTMKALYYSQRVHGMHQQEKYYLRKSNTILGIGYTAWDAIDMPYQLIKVWVSQIDKALLDIEPYKHVNEDLYLTYKERIEIECLQFVWLVLNIHTKSQPYTLKEKNEFINRALPLVEKYKVGILSKEDLLNWAKR